MEYPLFEDLVADMVGSKPDLRAAMYQIAAEAMLAGDVEEARLQVAMLTDATVGRAALAEETGRDEATFQGLFGPGSEPSVKDLGKLLAGLGRLLGLKTEIRVDTTADRAA